MGIDLKGQKEWEKGMKRATAEMKDEAKTANLRTGYKVLTSVRKHLTDFQAVDTGGLRSAYHLESIGEAGTLAYHEKPGIRGSGNYENSNGQTVSGWLHVPFSHESSVIVGSNAPHTAVTEHGRAPGATPPPSDALKPWLRRHNLDEDLAFVVARAIGANGLPPKPAFLLALEDNRDDHIRFHRAGMKSAANKAAKK
jgi:hypothetical protein